MNEELKIKIEDFENVRKKLIEAGASFSKKLDVKDTYFNQPENRVLKITEDDEGDFIVELKKDDGGFQIEMYEEIEDAEQKKEELENEHGIYSVVRKQRIFYELEDYTFNFNLIEGLGDFLVLEGENLSEDIFTDLLGIENPKFVREPFNKLKRQAVLSDSESVQKCVDMLLNNRYMNIATSKEDSPWSAPVYYSIDPELNLYFVSRRDSRHGKNIQENAKASVSIYDSTNPPEKADGVQIQGKGKIVEDQNLSPAVENLFRKRFEEKEKQQEYVNNPDKYSGASRKKIFKIETDHIYKVTGAYSRTEVSKQDIQKELQEIAEKKGLGKEHHERL